MNKPIRKSLVAGVATAVSVFGLLTTTSASAEELRVKQERDNIVYWVMPGPRVLSDAVFGTPATPKMGVADKIATAERLVADGKAPPSVPQLLRDLPILVGGAARGALAHGRGAVGAQAADPLR